MWWDSVQLYELTIIPLKVWISCWTSCRSRVFQFNIHLTPAGLNSQAKAYHKKSLKSAINWYAINRKQIIPMKKVLTFLLLITIMHLKAQHESSYKEPPSDIYDLSIGQTSTLPVLMMPGNDVIAGTKYLPYGCRTGWTRTSHCRFAYKPE